MAILEFINGKNKTCSGLKKSIKYILREDKTRIGLYGRKNCDAEEEPIPIEKEEKTEVNEKRNYVFVGYDQQDKPKYASLMGGLSLKPIDYYIKHHKIKQLVLCLDNDEAGHNYCSRIYEKYRERFDVYRQLPEEKDYNDELELNSHKRKKGLILQI